MLGFVDVDGLKTVNDAKGHLAGDALLRLLGELLRANVRPYDVMVRFGGDELLCAMPNLNAHEARARFEKIAAALAAVDADHSITFGIAEAEPADSLQDLIARADADLIEVRRSARAREARQGEPPNCGSSAASAGRTPCLGCTLTVASVKQPERPADEMVRRRLRAAIVAEDGDEEQLNGVIRMLGAVAPENDQLPVLPGNFGAAERHVRNGP